MDKEKKPDPTNAPSWQDSRELVAHTHVLIHRFRDGDRAAFDELYRRNHAPLRRSIARRLGYNVREMNGMDEDDFVQRSFAEAYQRISSSRPFDFRSPGSFLNLLVTIASNRIVDEVRRVKRQRRQAMTEPILDGEQIAAPAGTPSRELVRREEQEVFEHCLLMLPPRMRAVLDMRDLGMSFAEIGAALDLSEANARQVFTRTRRELQRLVHRQTGHESRAKD